MSALVTLVPNPGEVCSLRVSRGGHGSLTNTVLERETKLVAAASTIGEGATTPARTSHHSTNIHGKGNDLVKVEIDSSEPLIDAIRVIGALYDVTLTETRRSDLVHPTRTAG